MTPQRGGNVAAIALRLPSEAAHCFCGRSSDLQAAYLPSFPTAFRSVPMVDVRSCLPLRGSSGFTPDSHLGLTRVRKEPQSKTTISCMRSPCKACPLGEGVKYCFNLLNVCLDQGIGEVATAEWKRRLLPFQVVFPRFLDDLSSAG